MKRVIAVTSIALFAASAAMADDKPTNDEAAKIKDALTAWGCEGGEYEKESEGTGVFEVDDAKCKDGKQYDIKLDGSYNLISMSRD